VKNKAWLGSMISLCGGGVDLESTFLACIRPVASQANY
jgi:hypothetical protein